MSILSFPGEEPKKTTTSVPIKIMNKATPVFDKPFYSISVPENIQTHTAIISIEAHSPHGRKLIYSITKGDIYDEFAVDFNTGRGIVPSSRLSLAYCFIVLQQLLLINYILDRPFILVSPMDMLLSQQKK